MSTSAQRFDQIYSTNQDIIDVADVFSFIFDFTGESVDLLLSSGPKPVYSNAKCCLDSSNINKFNAKC